MRFGRGAGSFAYTHSRMLAEAELERYEFISLYFINNQKKHYLFSISRLPFKQCKAERLERRGAKALSMNSCISQAEGRHTV